jgi:HAD superfamily hydrolase (TIGR01509 family)
MTQSLNRQSLAGIIFDMDGVLCDSEPFILEAAATMFRQTYDLTVHKEDFRPFVGAGEDRFIGGVAERYGVALTMPRDKQRTYAIYLDIIRGRLHPLPGAVTFIHICRERGLKLALATSADRIKMDGNLAQIGIPKGTFDAIVAGEDVVRKKPDPSIFLLAAERLGLPPQCCMVIEDAVNGIKAGKAAGCRCVCITSSFSADALTAAGADHTAPDLAHVPPDAVN